MMNNAQYLLAKLAEEAVEIAQMAIKCQHFGLTETQPGNPESNVDRLKGELNDLLGVVSMLNREVDSFNFSPDVAAIGMKVAKVNHFREYSRSLGLVE